MSAAKAGNARQLLIFLDNHLGLAGNFFGRDFDRNLAFDAVFLRSLVASTVSVGLTLTLSACPAKSSLPDTFGLSGRLEPVHTPLILSVKT